jgi:hypothetical protein
VCRETRGKEPLGIASPRRDDNIKMNINGGRRGINFCLRIEKIGGSFCKYLLILGSIRHGTFVTNFELCSSQKS